jgi:hypothetical protein
VIANSLLHQQDRSWSLSDRQHSSSSAGSWFCHRHCLRNYSVLLFVFLFIMRAEYQLFSTVSFFNINFVLWQHPSSL